jgi:hypothetical protein
MGSTRWGNSVDHAITARRVTGDIVAAAHELKEESIDEIQVWQAANCSRHCCSTSSTVGWCGPTAELRCRPIDRFEEDKAAMTPLGSPRHRHSAPDSSGSGPLSARGRQRNHHRFQCVRSATGWRGPGLKSLPSVWATAMRATCMTSS